MPTAHCPDRSQLLAYQTGELSQPTAGELIEHICSCPRCQAELQTVRDHDTLAAKLRGPEAASPYLAEPQCQALIRGAKAMVDGTGTPATIYPHSPATVLPGDRLGEYELLEKLGEGGMGTVYKARQVNLDRIVALKVLPGGKSGDPQAVARFYREMQAVGRVDHPNVVRAMDAREIEGKPVLVMEYVEGVNLADLARRHGKLPIAEACEIIRQAAVGLDDAHQHGLVHRDIKPSNLMLTPGGAVKILDLGLALLHAGQAPGEEMTSSGQPMGTADYIAPEQVSDAHAVDLRADIYSLGCTLYRLLAGEAPFAGPPYKTSFDKMSAHVRTPVPAVGKIRPEVPADLAAALDRMLAKDPGKRFATAEEVVRALARFAAGSDLPRLAAEAALSGPAADAMTAVTDPFVSLPSTGTQPHPSPGDGGRGAADGGIVVQPSRLPPMTATPPGVVQAGGTPAPQAGGIVVQPSRLPPMTATPPGIVQAGGTPAQQAGRRTVRPWLVALLLATGGTAAVLAILIHYRDKEGKERTVEAADNSPITIEHKAVTAGVAAGANGVAADVGRIANPSSKAEGLPSVGRIANPSGGEADLQDGLAIGPTGKPGPRVSSNLIRPKPVRIVLEPEPVAIKPGEPLSEMAMVVSPAPLEGARSWTIETIGHRGKVTTLAYSPDGSRLATGGEDGTIHIWDPTTGKLLRAFLGARDRIYSLGWSPDGSMLAVDAGLTDEAKILDVESGLRLRGDLRDFSAPWGVPSRALWSPDGRRIAYHGPGEDVVISTLPTAYHRPEDDVAISLLPSRDQVFLRGVGEGFHSLAWSPDGSTVATSSGGGTLVWDAATGRQRKRLNAPGGSQGAAWSPDGTMLALTGTGSGKCEVWETKTWRLRYSFPGDGWYPVPAWSPDSRTVAFGCRNRVEPRDVETGSVRWRVQSEGPFAFAPDGKTLAVGIGEEIHFLDAATGQVRSRIPGQQNHITCFPIAAFSPDGSRLAAANEKQMRLWDLKTGSLIGECGGPAEFVVWSADGKAIAGTFDGRSYIWDAALRECEDAFSGWAPICLSADGRRLVNRDGKAMRLWDVAAGRQLLELPSPDARYSLSPDGKTLAVAAEKGVKLYDTTTAATTGSLEGAERPDYLAWSPDAKILAVATEKGLKLYDATTASATISLEGAERHDNLAWSRDGKTLSAVCDETIRLWDAASGRHTEDSTSLRKAASLIGPRCGIDSACWLDEQILVMGSVYGACVWDSRSRTVLRTMPGYPGTNCCFSPAARLVAFPALGLIRLRSLDDGRLLYTLLSLRDNFTGVVGPEGHLRGTPGLEKELVYVVQTERGQETLAPEAFAKKYRWKNDPSKATPKAD